MSAYRVGDTVHVIRMDEAEWEELAEWQQEAMAGAIGRCAVIVAIQPGGELLDLDGLFPPGTAHDGLHEWGVGPDEIAPCPREDYELQACLDRLAGPQERGPDVPG